MGELESLFDAHVEVSPPLGAEALKAIPAKRGVFLLTADDGRPILLTTAADIRGRLRFRLAEPQADDQPHKTADLREITAAVWWKLAYSPFETEWRFLELARQLYPKTYTALLSHRPAWFVGIDLGEEFPGFARTNRPGPPGRQVGPFPDKHAAERYVEALIDAFDLCRCHQVLRQAPRGTACAYKQMGRCAAPCDGTGSMDDYRRLAARAAEFAAGRREPYRQALAEQMRQAAGQMRYEQAAACKARLERLTAFEAAKFAHVAPLEDFRFVLVQAGPKASQACAFVSDRGAVAEAGVLDYPPRGEQLEAVLAAADGLAAEHVEITEADRWRMSLVTAYLFAARQKRGLIVRRDQCPDAVALAAALEQSADDLKLRPSKPRGRKVKKQDEGGTLAGPDETRHE